LILYHCINYEELIGDQTLAKLNEIFQNLIRRQEDKIDPIRSKYGNIEKDEVDLETKTVYVEEYIQKHRSFSFRKLLEKQGSKMEVVVTFLVVLELIKTGRVSVVQENIFDDIMITSNEA